MDLGLAGKVALVGTALDRFGALDVLVANSGGPPPMRALEVDDASLTAALDANLMTSVRWCRPPHPRCGLRYGAGSSSSHPSR